MDRLAARLVEIGRYAAFAQFRPARMAKESVRRRAIACGCSSQLPSGRRSIVRRTYRPDHQADVVIAQRHQVAASRLELADSCRQDDIVDPSPVCAIVCVGSPPVRKAIRPNPR